MVSSILTGKLKIGRLTTPEVTVYHGIHRGFEDIYQWGGTPYFGFKFTTKF